MDNNTFIVEIKTKIRNGKKTTHIKKRRSAREQIKKLNIFYNLK